MSRISRARVGCLTQEAYVDKQALGAIRIHTCAFVTAYIYKYTHIYRQCAHPPLHYLFVPSAPSAGTNHYSSQIGINRNFLDKEIAFNLQIRTDIMIELLVHYSLTKAKYSCDNQNTG